MQVLLPILLAVAFFRSVVRSADVCYMNQLNFPGLIKPDIKILFSGGEFKVKCKRPYTVRPGRNTITCEEGKWDIRYNPCGRSKYFCFVDELNYPGLIKPLKKWTTSGRKFEIKCKSPYTNMSGKNTITCYKGKWSINSNPCTKVDACSDIPAPARGSVKYLSPLKTSDLSSEFYHRRYRTRLGRLPQDMAAPLSQNLLETSAESNETAKPIGLHQVESRAMFQCQSRYYRLDGSRTRVCQENGSWSGTRALCIPVCGKPTDVPHVRILHGNATSIGQWPWQAAIARHFTSFGWFITCGGSLLTELWVITAAHCVFNKETDLVRGPDEFQVYLGKYYRSDSKDDEFVEVKKIQKILVHPDYNPRITEADIALIRLKSPVQFSSRIQPVCLPTKQTTRSLVEGKEGIVTGWGRTEEGRSSDTLLQASLPLISHAKCKKAYRELNPPALITNNMFCAGFKQGGADSCQGDSGGPFVFTHESANVRRWILEGIVSWGRGCGVSNQYGVYTVVGKFSEWIHRHI